MSLLQCGNFSLGFYNNHTPPFNEDEKDKKAAFTIFSTLAMHDVKIVSHHDNFDLFVHLVNSGFDDVIKSIFKIKLMLKNSYGSISFENYSALYQWLYGSFSLEDLKSNTETVYNFFVQLFGSYGDNPLSRFKECLPDPHTQYYLTHPFGFFMSSPMYLSSREYHEKQTNNNTHWMYFLHNLCIQMCNHSQFINLKTIMSLGVIDIFGKVCGAEPLFVHFVKILNENFEVVKTRIATLNLILTAILQKATIDRTNDVTLNRKPSDDNAYNEIYILFNTLHLDWSKGSSFSNLSVLLKKLKTFFIMHGNKWLKENAFIVIQKLTLVEQQRITQKAHIKKKRKAEE